MLISEMTTSYHMKRAVTYAADYNTAVVKKLPMRHISGCIYHGKIKPLQYGGFTCRLFAWFEEKDICVDLGIIDPDRYTAEQIIAVPETKDFQCLDSFLAMLDAVLEAENKYVSNLLIEASKFVCPEKTALLIQARADYQARKQAEASMRREAKANEDAEFCKAQNAIAQSIVCAAINTIIIGGELINERIRFHETRYSSREYSIINYLAKEFGVNIPIKVQGWINSSLHSVKIEDGRLVSWRRLQGKSKSSTFQIYFEQLLTAIRQKNARRAFEQE